MKDRESIKQTAPGTPDVVRYGDTELDTAARVAVCAGRRAELTGKECALLAALLRAPGRVWTRAALLAAVWQAPGALRTRTVDAHVHQLRRKLGAGQRIVTHYRVGYSWQAQAPRKSLPPPGEGGSAARH